MRPALLSSRSSNFFSAEAVGIGNESKNARQWSGKIPETGNYYIYVTAYPVANYVLRVRLNNACAVESVFALPGAGIAGVAKIRMRPEGEIRAGENEQL